MRRQVALVVVEVEVGSPRFSEPVVIIGEMSNTVTKEYS